MKKGRMMSGRRVLAIASTAALSVGVVACGSDSSSSGGGGGGNGGSKKVTIGLITKEDSNPFFIAMKGAAQDAAKKDNVDLITAAGKNDADNASQVNAIEQMTTQGAKGILITPADTKAIIPAVKKARAAGVTVIALDTPTDPQSAVDALYATDNLKAGIAIGKYAKALATKMGIKPVIGMLDLAPGITVGKLRHEGFLQGFGIKEGDPAIAGSVDTLGEQAKGQTGMEQLLQKNPNINIVYSINEPSGFGGATALKSAGKDPKNYILVSVDGGCDAINKGINKGIIDATSQQYPSLMASDGVKNIAAAARGGKKPTGYHDTGVTLITNNPMKGVDSKDGKYGSQHCWG
jgi:fructose transport system substrate-binding protein